MAAKKSPKGAKASDPNKPTKKRKRTLPEEANRLLNQRLDAVESDLRAMTRILAATENAHNRVVRRVVAAEDDAEALLNAVRVLADLVPYTTGPGKRARAEARGFLAARKIPPPSTLGAARKRSKKKAKKRS